MSDEHGDVHEGVRRFNEDEAVWRRFEEKRKLRRLTKTKFELSEELLDHFDWIAAERECRELRAVGRDV